MDDIKIILILFMNLIIIFIFSLIISTCVRNYRKKISYEEKNLLVLKEVFPDLGVILLLICAVLFYHFS